MVAGSRAKAKARSDLSFFARHQRQKSDAASSGAPGRMRRYSADTVVRCKAMRRLRILFDLDGTLTDPKEGIVRCLRFALDKLDVRHDPHDGLEWVIGPPLRESLAKILGPAHAQLVDSALAVFRQRFATIGLFENAVYDGIADSLARLAVDNDLYLATSKPAVFARQILDHFALSRYFCGVYGSELDGTRSNKAELLRHLLDEEQIAAADAVMIGDREHDIIAAKQNGLPGVGVLWGYGSEAELRAAGAARLLSHPSELLGFSL
jgi:phosphoglycolate phosphatase